jgi:hypothetical protein
MAYALAMFLSVRLPCTSKEALVCARIAPPLAAMHAVMDSNVFVPLKVQLAVVPAQTRPVLLQVVVSCLVEDTLTGTLQDRI